jgi:hypothetical protein
MPELPTSHDDGRREETDEAAAEVRITVEEVHVFGPPPALEPSRLVGDVPHGVRTESDVLRRAASEFSSSFVFTLPDVIRGRARREPGDGLVLVDSRLLVLQVKARDKESQDSEDRARAWTNKSSARALSQLRGTMRALRSTAESMNLEPVDPPEGLEEARLVLDPSEIKSMAGVLGAWVGIGRVGPRWVDSSGSPDGGVRSSGMHLGR